MVAFHVHWLKGGWLGVDVFFVLSGFLITRLLLTEANITGRIDLRQFWLRRAKRLLPPVLVLVAFAAWWERTRQSTTRFWDVLGALTYSSNWVQLATTNGYWDRFAEPRVLDHLWSLAIEEQFYLVWPLAIAVIVRLGLSRRATGIVMATLAVSLAEYSLLIFKEGASPSRVYAGTDTRAMALVVGALVATLPGTRWRPALYRPAIALSGGLLVWMTISLRGSAQFVYSGGLVLGSVASALLVASVVGRGIPSVLDVRPLVWLGQRSYGVYLWHWPICIALDVADRPRSTASAQMGVVVLSLGAAEVSARLIENPIRAHGFAAFDRRGVAVRALGVAILAVAATGIVLPTRSADVDAVELSGSTLESVAPSTTVASTTSTSTAAVQPPTAQPPTHVPTSIPASTVPAAPARLPSKVARPEGRQPKLMVVGDSVGEYLATTALKSLAGIGAQFVNHAQSNCVWALETVRTRERNGDVIQDHPDECITRLQALDNATVTISPDAAVIIFGGGLFHENEVSPGRWHNACSTEFALWFTRQITGAVTELRRSGTPVYVATESYYRAPREPDLDSRDDETDCKNKIIRSTAATASYVVVDLGGFVCPDRDRCPNRDAGVVLRPDGIHFAGPGAIVTAMWIVSEIFEAV